MRTELPGVQSQKFWLSQDGLSTMFSMRWLFADRFFIPRWHHGPNQSNQSSLRRPSANLICQNLIPRSQKPVLPNHRRKPMLPRKQNGISPGQRSCQMALVSVSGTTWALAALARRAATHINALSRNPMGAMLWISHGIAAFCCPSLTRLQFNGTAFVPSTAILSHLRSGHAHLSVCGQTGFKVRQCFTDVTFFDSSFFPRHFRRRFLPSQYSFEFGQRR